MSTSDIGHKIMSWWRVNIYDRDSSAARGLAARLRRAGMIETLSEPQVHVLAREIGIADAVQLASLVQVLAIVREHSPEPLATRLGGDPPVLSRGRFQRLMRADDAAVIQSLRRALRMVEQTCNVATLGRDVLWWNDKTRARWCFEYYGTAVPKSLSRAARSQEFQS